MPRVTDRTSLRDLKEFQPNEQLPDGFTMIYYGLRRCGKNVNCRHLLATMYDRLKDHEIHIITGTGVYNYEKQWEWVPRSSVHTEIDRMEEILQEIMQPREEWFQRRFDRNGGDSGRKKRRRGGGNRDDEPEINRMMSGRFGKNTAEGKAMEVDIDNVGDSDDGSDDDDDDEEECPFPPLLFILDDCVHDNTIRYCPTLNKIFIAGRHMGCDIIVFSQNVRGGGSVPPPIREQAEVLIIMQNPRAMNARKVLEDEYLTASNSIPKGAGLALMEEVNSEPHRGFVITKTNQEARYLKDYCFYYGPVPFDQKKDKHPRWVERLKFGTDEQWEKDEEMANKNAVQCNPNLQCYDPSKGKAKRKRGKMVKGNTQYTFSMQRNYDGHVTAPSSKRIKMSGNIFGSVGQHNPRR